MPVELGESQVATEADDYVRGEMTILNPMTFIVVGRECYRVLVAFLCAPWLG